MSVSSFLGGVIVGLGGIILYRYYKKIHPIDLHVRLMGDGTPLRISSLCVFCGASGGVSPEFSMAAEELGKAMVGRGIALVYGGGAVGIMGHISKSVNDLGGSVTGVLPEAFLPYCGGEGIGTQEIVTDMHTRKQRMCELSDAFIALPGGLGTLEELLEIICWSQLGIHNKPIGVLNLNGYYDPLLQQVEVGIEKGFVREEYRGLFVVADSPSGLLDKLEAHQPPRGFTDWRKCIPSSAI